MEALINRYNIPVPRYTSYPTVPEWKEIQDVSFWPEALRHMLDNVRLQSGVSLYIHLPFCENLCTYCGCNKRITKNHNVEAPYLEAVLTEWKMYRQFFGHKIPLAEIHLGGGTPTFFSPANLRKLMKGIYEHAALLPGFEAGFEGHPNNTTEEHLLALYDLGFRRVSFGVQDLDEKVQKAIHRIQPFENVKKVTALARKIGYTSVNFDLIYGLPFQQLASIEATIDAVTQLQPDRLAFYSYAHVPWASKSQRAYDENDLPKGSEKLELYQKGREMLLKAGYNDIGMDHFALANDSLMEAHEKGTLHRNFMGYTTHASPVLLGLGVSAISDIALAYGQNVKTVEEYYQCINSGQWPIFKGIQVSAEQQERRGHILNVICRDKTAEIPFYISDDNLFEAYLDQLLKDGLVIGNKNAFKVTSLGRSFLRNIAALFDKDYLLQQKLSTNKFSKAI